MALFPTNNGQYGLEARSYNFPTTAIPSGGLVITLPDDCVGYYFINYQIVWGSGYTTTAVQKENHTFEYIYNTGGYNYIEWISDNQLRIVDTYGGARASGTVLYFAKI